MTNKIATPIVGNDACAIQTSKVGVPPIAGNQIGVPLISETASIAYDGTLLPAGTGVDTTKRYLKDLGKDKNHVLVESGQGKFFNGSNQYINTGIIPNQAEGTLVTRFTYASGAVSRWVYGSSEIGVWINASGKIECVFGNATYTITDTLVAGRSYHVEIPYQGLSAEVILDGVTKGTATVTVFNPTLPMFIGARNASGTADRFFNSVIDETYYYDVKLDVTQISTLYQYPEKVKSYNGAIVPDIGSEANCKLFLPLCENSGSNVVNVAVARGSELVVNGGFDSDTSWTKTTGWAISGGLLNANVGNYSSSRQSFSFSVGKAYLCTYEVTSFSSGSVRLIFIGGTQVSGTARTTIGVYSEVLYAVSGNNEIGVQSVATGFVGSIDNVSVKEITAYPLVSYTTAMHTSAAKLSYGAQCTAWKRDSLGVLLGISNGLSFDGGVSVKEPNSLYVPTINDSFVFEAILSKNDGVDRYFGDLQSACFRKHTSNVVYCYTFSGNGTPAIAQTEAYAHYICVYNGTTKLHSFYKNGVLVSQRGSVATTNYSKAIIVGSSTEKGLDANFKIHKGTQYAKFDIAKSWKNAQKIIAKLGA